MIPQTRFETRAILSAVRTIAIVGLSADPRRPSNDVATFLRSRGYTCVGVNPGLAGQIVLGMPVFATLADVDRPIDMVDIFRASRAVAGIVEDVLAMAPPPRVVWMQLGVIDAVAKARAEQEGLLVVMDRCPKIELSG